MNDSALKHDAVDLSTSRNLLLSGLPAEDKRLIQSLFRPTRFTARSMLGCRDQPIESACFIETGLAAIVASGPDGRRESIGLTGRAGMTGLPLILGVDQSPFEGVVLIAGTGMTIDRLALRSAMSMSRRLRDRLFRYVQAFHVQAVQTALAKSQANIKARLARWILIAHDAVDGVELPLTHELISTMLGVRRAGVTVALHELEGDRLIRSTRGSIAVVDPDGLEMVAGGCYGLAEAEYERLLGTSPMAGPGRAGATALVRVD